MLVQQVAASGVSDTEGILVAVSRLDSYAHFRYLIDWQNDTPVESFSPRSIVRTKFGNFPYWKSRMRSIMIDKNTGACSGPMKLALRSS